MPSVNILGAGLRALLGSISFLVGATTSIAQDNETQPWSGGDPRLQGIEVTFDTFLSPPYNRWGLRHVREIVPTRAVPAGPTQAPLSRNPRPIGDLTVDFGKGRVETVEHWLKDAYTDGFVVLHKGQVAYERYFNGQSAESHHLMFSVTKSFTGAMMLMLMEKGLVDADARVGDLVDELKSSAFAGATVQQMLDMTNSIEYLEDYYNPEADITRFLMAMGPQGEGLYANLVGLTRLHPKFSHGEAFHYVTPDPEVLGWIIREVTGKSLADALHSMIWSNLGAQQDAYYWLDYHGIEMAGGGLSMTLRDAARFGQMILQDGYFNDRQILPKSVAQRIKQQRNAALFSKYYDDPWYGNVAGSYHDQWWGYSGTAAVSAIGVHGQFIYIDQSADMVIAKQTSDPEAEGQRVDWETPVVMHAIAEYLTQIR